MTPADRIIAKFKGVRKLARALGHENPSTVQGWKERGIIPVKHAPKIIEAGAKNRVRITPSDFVPFEGVSHTSQPVDRPAA